MSKKEKILSVSVACYNLKEMIIENIESFCKSKVAEDIELIITDDGSKDNTPDIVEEYAKKYPNTVKFIRKENGGPGSTVNSGIKHATGKYFRMVDGDDWVETENLEEYIELLKNTDSDMVVSDYEIYDNSINKIIETKTYNIEAKKEFSFDEVCEKLPQEMHAIAFKTKIFKENNITVDNGFYTDVEYVLFPMTYVNTITYFNKPIYVYRVAQATQSVNPNSMKKNIGQHETVVFNLMKYYENNKINISSKKQIYICNRINAMAADHLGIMLLFDANKVQKESIRKYLFSVTNISSDIYSMLKRNKKVRLMRYSKYILYPLVSKITKKRMGV